MRLAGKTGTWLFEDSHSFSRDTLNDPSWPLCVAFFVPPCPSIPSLDLSVLIEDDFMFLRLGIARVAYKGNTLVYFYDS